MKSHVEIFNGNTQQATITYEPGNGTTYYAVATKLLDRNMATANSWLFSFPTLGVAYYFGEGSYLSVDYVKSKIGHNGGTGDEISLVDIQAMMQMIAMITHGATDIPEKKKKRKLKIAR